MSTASPLDACEDCGRASCIPRHCAPKLRALLGQALAVLRGLAGGVVLATRARRIIAASGAATRRAQLVDLDAERVVLAHALRTGRLFAGPARWSSLQAFALLLHRDIAVLATTSREGGLLRFPESRSYVCALSDGDAPSAAATAAAAARVLELHRRRRALRLAEAAVVAMRNPDAEPHATAGMLREAADVLEGCYR